MGSVSAIDFNLIILAPSPMIGVSMGLPFDKSHVMVNAM